MTTRNKRGKLEIQIEGVLCLSALVFVLLPALILVFLAKGRTDIADAVWVNEDSAEQLALALPLDIDLANRLIARRSQLGGFDSTDQMLHTPLFSRADADRLTETLAQSRLDPTTATPRQFASVLGIAPTVAQRLAAFAQHIPHAAPAPDSPPPVPTLTPTGTAPGNAAAPTAAPPAPSTLLRRVTLFAPGEMETLHLRCLVRRPGTVLRTFALCGLLLCGLLLFVPPLLRGRLRVGGDPFLVPLALLLSALGVAMMFSVGDPLRDTPRYLHHAEGIVLAVLVLLFGARLVGAARQRIRLYGYVWAIGAGLLIVLLAVLGRGPEGVKLNLFGIQPVEIVKLMLVFFVAGYLGERAGVLSDASRRYTPPRFEGVKRTDGRPAFALSLPRLQDLGPVGVMFALTLVLFFVLKDLGPGLLLFATFIAMLYLATGRGGYVLIGAGCLLVGGVLGYLRHIGVFATRVDMWLHPFANTHPNGMQLGQALWAFSTGGWEGSGLGLGRPDLIPRGQDDLAFVSWSEETGLFGAWLLLVCYAVLIWRGIRIALRANTEFDRALAFGLTALLGLQTLLILGGVTGLCPLTGIALPFLSFGDSALVADFLLIGLLRGISVGPTGGVGRPDARPEVRRAGRNFAFAMGVALLGIVGVYRLGQTQVIQADRFATRSVQTPDGDKITRPHLNPRLLSLSDEIERGSLYDRDGRILATSRRTEILQLERDPVRARRLIAARERVYPFRDATAHLVGYLNPGVGGPYGMERAFNDILRGYHQATDLLPKYRNHNLPGYDPPRGRDLHLTIDASLQRDIQAILWRRATRLKDKQTGKPKDRAAFVLLSPATGDVLAAVSIPSFEPNDLTPERYQSLIQGANAEAEHPLINRALDGLYPPGSTLKIATAACALEHLSDALSVTYVCNQIADVSWPSHGGTAVRRNIRDDKGDPRYGPLSLAPAFRVSSNIYFANLAAALGAKTLHETLADRMGFHRAPTEAILDADLPDIGYGQGRMLASPLEMARLAASVANDGKMMRARFVTGQTDPLNRWPKINVAPQLLADAMSPPTANTLRDLMRSVVTRGTARGVFDDELLAVAGKTGTAQNPQFDREPHSWFVGIAPYDVERGGAAPRYAFACVIENGGYGKTAAALVCRDVLKKLR